MADSPFREPDYYAVLRVAPDATPGEIERAYRLEAGRRLNARWRPGRAARELALLNAAYGILAYADRRADYDRRRAEAAAGTATDDGSDGLADDPPVNLPFRGRRQTQLPRVQLGRPTSASPADVVIIGVVVMLAILVGSLFATRSLIDLSFIQNFGEAIGVAPRRRPAITPAAATTAAPVEVKPSPAPATPVPATPEAPPGALPTALAGQRYAGTQVLVSDPLPPRQSNLTVTLKLMREGQPVQNANVYLIAHYRTLDERQPPGNATVRTDANGTATIAFNIGDATPGYQVNLEIVTLVEGQQVVQQASFTPR